MSTMNISLPVESWDAQSERTVDQLLLEYDDTSMALPSIEFAPQQLISKVRKHYLDYIIKLLSDNYENNHKLINKNIYLPSAIWRCAKEMEMTAAQASMVVQIYRNNVVGQIKQLKSDTKKGRLHKKLFNCLRIPPDNEKKTQTSLTNTCNCQCVCDQRKKRRRISSSPRNTPKENLYPETFVTGITYGCKEQQINKIPVVMNMHAETPQPIISKEIKQTLEIPQEVAVVDESKKFPPKPDIRSSVDLQDPDDLMMQLEKLFQDSNDDDIFDSTLIDETSFVTDNHTKSDKNNVKEVLTPTPVVNNLQTDMPNIPVSQSKSLDERLESLAELLVNPVVNIEQKPEKPEKKSSSSKWLCEEYFLKVRLFELLDEIGDCNRKKLARIKDMLHELFGDDSDDEGVVSPLEESPEFITSCKERIAPWVVKLLTPYYIKGRIKGKALFKALAKHLIRLIYQCSRYPSEYEVKSFVTDFLQNHKLIRCEADFKQFRIENI